MAGQGQPGPSNAPMGPVILPRLELDFVRMIAESIGANNLTLNGQVYIAEQVTHLLKRVVYDAHKFTIHGRRAKMVGDDIEAALKLIGLENMIPLGHTLPNPPPMVQINNPYGDDLFVPDDTEIDLKELRKSAPSTLPVGPYLRAHWLVYNGTIPRIPENVEPSEEEETTQQSSSSTRVVETKDTDASTSAGLTFRKAARDVSTKEKVIVQSVPPESLSVEQQKYFKDIVEACVGTDDKRRQDALQSLEQDTGVQALLPRLSRLLFDAVHLELILLSALATLSRRQRTRDSMARAERFKLARDVSSMALVKHRCTVTGCEDIITRLNIVHRCMSMLIYLVRVIRALTNNKSVRLDPVLHELLPTLISCMVGRQLCLRPEVDNHWALRDFSAKTLITIVNTYDKNQSLRQRIYRLLRKVFDDPQSTYGQIFGATHALNEIMTHQERYECYNRYVDLTNACHPSAVSSLSPEGKAEAAKLYQILLKLETSMLRSYRRISESM